MIKNIIDLGKYIGLENGNEELIKKALYKATSCGVSVQFKDDSITICSIVEGVDYGTQEHTLIYPFSDSVFEEVILIVEREAQEIWNNTHGCDDCGLGGAVKFFDPCGSGTWYITSGYAINSEGNEIKLSEMEGKDIQDIMLFGYVTGLGCDEWGYISFNELSEVERFDLGIERDMYFGKHTVKEILEKSS